MPEGDTILRLAAKINDAVMGRTVESSIIRHPRLATLDLDGKTLVEATSHGKHLFLDFDDGWSLHIHLLMQGRVLVDRRSSAEEWRRRFELRFDDGSLIGEDIPLLHHLPSDDKGRFIGHLGPDLCGALDLELAVDHLAAAESMPLTGALLDQRHAAGFGNIYAVEVPFICGLSPFTPVAEIEGLDDLVAIGAALIRTNAHLGPQNTTGRKLSTGDTWMLDSGRTDCGICGERVTKASGAESPWRRRVAWCASCQAPANRAVDRARSRRLLSLHPARRLLEFGDDEIRYVGDRAPVTTRARH